MSAVCKRTPADAGAPARPRCPSDAPSAQYGELAHAGIEGTGSYGAGLARWLRARGVSVVEVDRPDRRTRRRRGKSDAVDAEAAARAVQAGIATAQPKAGTGAMEMLRTLRVARQSAIK